MYRASWIFHLPRFRARNIENRSDRIVFTIDRLRPFVLSFFRSHKLGKAPPYTGKRDDFGRGASWRRRGSSVSMGPGTTRPAINQTGRVTRGCNAFSLRTGETSNPLAAILSNACGYVRRSQRGTKFTGQKKTPFFMFRKILLIVSLILFACEEKKLPTVYAL